MDQARILVVDDEPNVGRFLIHVLKKSGYTVSVAHSVAEAWPRIESEEFDLLLVDKTMPGQSGSDLLAKLQGSAIEIPTVLLIGDVSVASVNEALALGAADYLSKPIVNTEHFVRRLQSVLDRRLTTLFFDVLLSDLSKALLAGTGKSETFTKLSRSLLSLRAEIGRRPACGVVDDNARLMEARVESIHSQNLISIGVPIEDLDTVFAGPAAPLVAAVSLESKNALSLIEHLHSVYPDLLTLAVAETTNARTALRAVEKGALDYAIIAAEGMRVCGMRIHRLVGQARRHALYVEIAALLYRAAKETRRDLPEDIIFASRMPNTTTERTT
jgi:DNA-binding NtrC family response regulator